MGIGVALGLDINRTEYQSLEWVRPTQPRHARPSAPAFGTLTLTVVFLAVMFIEMMVSHARLISIVNAFGLRSAVWSWTDLSGYDRILTYALLHGGSGHFFWNVTVFVLVGSVLEWRLGLRFVGTVFIVGAIVSGFAHLLMFPAEARPLIGASGAVSALFGLAVVSVGDIGMCIRIPRSTRWLSLNLRRLLVYWMTIQIVSLLSVLMSRDAPLQVAYWAHIAGFSVGVVAGFLYSQRADNGSVTAPAASFASAGD